MKSSLFQLLFLPGLIFLYSCSGQANGKPAEEKKDTKDSVSLAQRRRPDYLSDCSRLKRAAVKMDSTLMKQTELNLNLANGAIKAFVDLAYYCPADSLSPVFLIKTAQIAQAIHNAAQAKLALDQCIHNYPDFKDRAAALFLLAQLYDEASLLNDEGQARILYQKIIKEYPKSPWAESAQGAISFLGKSDQEIIDAIKKKK